MRFPLLSAVAEDGSGEPVTWPGGDGAFLVSGAFDGGTVTLEEYAGGEWRAVPDAALAVTAAAHVSFRLPRGRYRATVSDAGASTELTAELAE